MLRVVALDFKRFALGNKRKSSHRDYAVVFCFKPQHAIAVFGVFVNDVFHNALDNHVPLLSYLFEIYHYCSDYITFCDEMQGRRLEIRTDLWYYNIYCVFPHRTERINYEKTGHGYLFK